MFRTRVLTTKMSLPRNHIAMSVNSIAFVSKQVITQVTFGSITALFLMSFITPSEVVLASASLVDSKGEFNDVEEDERGKQEVAATDPFREKRAINQEYLKDVDYDYENITDLYVYPTYLPTNEEGVGGIPWKPGPMKTISDSVFSLIILIYVSVIFVFMFFAFCWKEPEPPPPDPAHKNIPMITSMLDEMEKQMEENKRLEEERISIEKGGSIGNECTEMTELKNEIEKSKYDSSSSINQSNINVTTSKEMKNNSSVINRKDAETIVVNVITEKTSKSSASVNFKEEQV